MPDFSPLIAEAARLRGLSSATSVALKRAAGTLDRRLPVEARRDIQDEYKLPAARIASGLNATAGDGAVVLTGYQRTVGLVEFGGRWSRNQEGASAQVFTAEGRHVYGGTFIAKGKGGNRQIFSRALVGGGKRAARLPLKTLYGPSVAQMLRKGDRPSRLDDFAQDVLSSEISRLLG